MIMAVWPIHRRRSHDHRARFALGIHDLGLAREAAVPA
jgi:hypothetical protein